MLIKLGYNSKKWQERWFVLEQTELFYYVKDGANDPRGMIKLFPDVVCESVLPSDQFAANALSPIIQWLLYDQTNPIQDKNFCFQNFLPHCCNQR